MMHSLNSVVSVQPLVEYLGIDPKVQQDFEEFSSLLRWVVNWLKWFSGSDDCGGNGCGGGFCGCDGCGGDGCGSSVCTYDLNDYQ